MFCVHYILNKKLATKRKNKFAKNNIVYESDCNNCKAPYFDVSSGPLKLRSVENQRSVENCDCQDLKNWKKKLENTVGKHVVMEFKKIVERKSH